MKLGKRENLEKTPKILTLPTTIVPLATPRLERRTPVGTHERCIYSYAGTAVSLT